MVMAVISILLEVIVILFLVFYAGQKAGWIYVLLRFVGFILVLYIYGSHKTASIRMTWMLVILLLPIFGTALYLMIGMNGHSLAMRRRYEDIDKILLPMLPANEEEAANARARDGRLGGLVEYIRRQAACLPSRSRAVCLRQQRRPRPCAPVARNAQRTPEAPSSPAWHGLY